MEFLADSFGRRFSYLRLSITDACNFRCIYCLPNGYRRPQRNGAPNSSNDTELSKNEIRNLVTAFAELGMWKIRLTGGEPTLRRDLVEIIRVVGDTPGVRRIALSTNGYRLKQLARKLKVAGLSAVNISIDSLDPHRFSRITGVDKLHDVLDGLNACLNENFSTVKVNAVLMKDYIEQDFDLFLSFIKDKPVTIRFIELMLNGQIKDLFQKRHVSGNLIQEKLARFGWNPKPREEGDGPATEWTHPDYVGKIGLIAPYSKDFCQTCNRLRVTSQGGLRLCLFAEGQYSIRHLLQEESQREELKTLLKSLLGKKEISHYLPEGRFGNNLTFSAMGG